MLPMGDLAPSYELYDGDVRLALLTNIQLYDFPWLSADFHPMPEYALYRGRLEAEYRDDDADAEAVEFEPLVLMLVDPRQGKSGSALLYDEGDWVRFRMSFD